MVSKSVFPSISLATSAATSSLFSIAAKLARTLPCALLAGAIVTAAASASAQTPIALPYTMTTIAGAAPMSSTPGTQCPNLPTGVVSTDAFGDGCLAVNGIFGAAARGGLQVDAYGYVFIADDINGVMHVINPVTGIMTVAAGKGTVCTGKLDAAGDGCIAATQTLMSSQRGISMDYYGNVISDGYGDNLMHILCRVASPNCTAAQIGTMQALAGCSAGTGSNGTSGVGLNNVPGKALNAGTCTTSKGEVYSPTGFALHHATNAFSASARWLKFALVFAPSWPKVRA